MVRYIKVKAVALVINGIIIITITGVLQEEKSKDQKVDMQII